MVNFKRSCSLFPVAVAIAILHSQFTEASFCLFGQKASELVSQPVQLLSVFCHFKFVACTYHVLTVLTILSLLSTLWSLLSTFACQGRIRIYSSLAAFGGTCFTWLFMGKVSVLIKRLNHNLFGMCIALLRARFVLVPKGRRTRVTVKKKEILPFSVHFSVHPPKAIRIFKAKTCSVSV